MEVLALKITMPFERDLEGHAMFGSPGRTRTCDQPVNSRLLYQLSYRGTRQSVVGLRILAKDVGWGETFLYQNNRSPCLRLIRYTSKSSVSSSSEDASVLPVATDA